MSQAIPDIPPEAYLTKVLDHPNQVEFYVSITKESVPKPTAIQFHK